MLARPFDGYRERRLGEIDDRYDAFLTAGFPCALSGVPETLQCRDDRDRTNWLTLLGICDEAIRLGAGAQNIPVPVRCTSNRSYVISYNDCLALLKNLRTWAAGAQANWWRLKDLVAACPTRVGLNDINLEEGWP